LFLHVDLLDNLIYFLLDFLADFLGDFVDFRLGRLMHPVPFLHEQRDLVAQLFFVLVSLHLLVDLPAFDLGGLPGPRFFDFKAIIYIM
jgi:hypothetical protein